MYKIRTFNSKRFGKFSIIIENNVPFFVANQIVEKLGYKSNHCAVRRHVDEGDKFNIKLYGQSSRAEDIRVTPIKKHEYAHDVLIINENALYDLVFNCKVKDRKDFKIWVVTVFIPQINKSLKKPPIKIEKI